MVCLNPKFRLGLEMLFFGLGPWAIYPWYGQIGKYFYLSNINFDDTICFSKLSENHKIVEIGSTEFKLWQLKESPNH